MSPQDLRSRVRELVVQAQASVAARPSINPSEDGEVWDMAARLLVASGGAEAVDVHIGADGMPKIPSAQTLSSIYSAAFASSGSVNINSAVDRGFDAVANTVAAPFRSELCEARARIAALESALARCRDAFDIPEPGDGAEEDWASSIGMPDCVPDFVEQSVRLMKADHQRLLDKHNALHASAAQCRQELAARVPIGYMAAPVNPTPEMKAAGAKACTLGTDIAHYTYCAMLAAAPQPVVQGEPFGYVYSWVHSSATGRPDETFTGFAKTLADAKRSPANFDIRPVYTHPQPERVVLTDEQDRALCEAHCNDASDEYFKARPQLDSAVNRRIFYAGHRKAWITKDETAHGIKGAKK